jgi:cytochrome P450
VIERLFKKGTYVMLPARLQHTDPAIWGEDYDQFVPDRFIRAEDKGNPQEKPQEVGEKEPERRRLAKERVTRPFGGGVSRKVLRFERP